MSEHDLPPPGKPKLSKKERRTRSTDRLKAIRLRVLIVPFRPGPRLLSAGVLAAFTAFDRG
jgi:hypothetical protein